MPADAAPAESIFLQFLQAGEVDCNKRWCRPVGSILMFRAGRPLWLL